MVAAIFLNVRGEAIGLSIKLDVVVQDAALVARILLRGVARFQLNPDWRFLDRGRRNSGTAEQQEYDWHASHTQKTLTTCEGSWHDRESQTVCVLFRVRFTQLKGFEALGSHLVLLSAYSERGPSLSLLQ
jgi:hypothetical protein